MRLIRSFILFSCGLACAEPEPYRVTDFKAAESYPQLSRSIAVGSSLFFVKAIPDSKFFFGDYYGTLYRTDGSATGTKGILGTTLYTDDTLIVIAENSHRPAVCGDQLYFVGTSGNGGRRVYRMGENDTRPTAVGNVYEPRHITAVGARVFFTGMDYTFLTSLWKSDGTTSGTVRITNATLGPNPNITSMMELHGKLYFHATTAAGTLLFQSDGTNEGTVPVERPSSLDPYISLVSFGNELYFATRYGLYKSTDPSLAPVRVLGGDIRMARTLGGSLILVTVDSTNHLSLWKSDGSAAGTTRIMDLPGSNYDYNDRVDFVSELGGSLYFGVTREHGTLKLWKTDASTGGTQLVWDALHARQGIRGAIRHQDRMYLSLLDENLNPELWLSDGTEAGTRRIAATSARDLRVAGSLLYFFAPGYPHADELFAFDDTPAAPPEITASVTGVSRFSADLALTIDPNRSETTATIHYGSTPAHGSLREIRYRPGNGTLPEAATATLDGLTHGTTYHYKIVASNSAGEAAIVDRTFTTTANRAPVLNPIARFTYDHAALPVAVEDILRHADDPESDTLTATLGASPSGATITRDDNRFLYSPPPGFVGTDHIPYVVTDNVGASSDSVISIHVAGDFGHPWLVGGPSVHVWEGLPPSSSIVSFLSSANPSQTYIVQRSTDLRCWKDVGTSVGDSGGFVQFIDEAPPPGQAFYRLLKP